MNYWERRSGDMREMSPEISIEGDEEYVGKKRKSCKKRPKSETKARRFSAELLTREELAIRKMKAFSTRGSTLRTVDDEDLVRTLVDVNGHPLSQEMKNACLEYNAKTTELNERHETEMASKSLIREVSADGAVEPKSRTWTHEEDALVRQLVDEHGPQKWAYIAERLVGKTQKQVYARWCDYLQPGLTTKPWSAEEQARLVELQAHVGNQWAVLARLMPGRSPNAIKNRFHATKRKLERHNRRDGSNLGPGASDATGTTGATGGRTVSVSVGGRAGGSKGGPTKSVGTARAPAMSEEYSKEEQLAVEGLLLADTPTSLMAQRERRAADAQFDAALDVQDRLGQEATKAAKAAAK